MKLKKFIKIVKGLCNDANGCKTCPFHVPMKTAVGSTYYNCIMPELPGNWDYKKLKEVLKRIKKGDKK